MQNETVTFDKLPEAVGYLTEQVIELKRMCRNFSLQHQTNTCWLKLRMLAVSSEKPSLPYTHWYAKGCFRLTKKARSSISMRMSCWHGLTTGGERRQNRLMKRCLPICKAVSSISLNHPLTSNRLTYGYKFYQSCVCHR